MINVPIVYQYIEFQYKVLRYLNIYINLFINQILVKMLYIIMKRPRKDQENTKKNKKIPRKNRKHLPCKKWEIGTFFRQESPWKDQEKNTENFSWYFHGDSYLKKVPISHLLHGSVFRLLSWTLHGKSVNWVKIVFFNASKSLLENIWVLKY